MLHYEYVISADPFEHKDCHVETDPNHPIYEDYTFLTLRPNLPSDAKNYKEVKAELFIDGKIDNDFVTYLNGEEVFRDSPGWEDAWGATCDLKYLNRAKIYHSLNLESTDDVVTLNSYSYGMFSATVLYEAWIKVQTTSK